MKVKKVFNGITKWNLNQYPLKRLENHLTIWQYFWHNDNYGFKGTGEALLILHINGTPNILRTSTILFVHKYIWHIEKNSTWFCLDLLPYITHPSEKRHTKCAMFNNYILHYFSLPMHRIFSVSNLLLFLLSTFPLLQDYLSLKLLYYSFSYTEITHLPKSINLILILTLTFLI